MSALLARVGAPIALVAACVGLGPVLADEPAAVAATSLTSVLDECSALKLAANGQHVKDKTVTIGRMKIMLSDGTLVPVLGKSGSVLGAYFEGHGGYLYTAESPGDREALEANIARVAGSLRPVGGRVNDTFKTVLVLSSDPALTEFPAGPDSPPEAPSGSMATAFTAALADALSGYGEFDFRTALARLNNRGRWLYAEFAGGLTRVGYAHDDVLSGRERLFTFRKLVDYKTRFSETISNQPLAGWTAEQKRFVMLKHADISVATSDNKSGTIDSDMTYHLRGLGTRAIPLQLVNSRDPDAGTWNSQLAKLTLKRVLDAEGKELAFSHKYDEVVVEIPATTSAESDVRLRFETEGDIFVDMAGHHDDSYFSLGFSDWYPAPMNWASEQFTYTLKVRCKKPWRPVTSGEEVLLRDDGDFMVSESRSDQPTALITVMGGKYITRAETTDGVTVRVHAYAMARKNVLDNMPKLAGALIKYYTSILGPMPGDELDIVEVPEYGFGISPAGVVLLTTEAYKPHQDEIANYLARGINARLAHEIAHQWFGHKAVPADPSEDWISESFAEYFSGLALGTLAGNDKKIFGFTNMLAEWKADDRSCSDGAPIAAASYLGGEGGWKDRRCLLYSRGPLVLHMLRTSIGNDRFMAVARKFLDGVNVGPATTTGFAAVASDVVQMDMGWYFDQWVRRSGNAVVDVEQHVDVASNGQYRLWGAVRQSPGEGFKKLLVPLVWDNKGKTEARVVFADQPEKKFDFLVPVKPSGVKPDPFQNNLAVYK